MAEKVAGANAKNWRTTRALRVGTARLSGEEEVEGGPLLRLLSHRAQELSHTKKQMAEEYLGVTYGYLSQLSSGHRKTENISAEFITACAQYLRVPRLTVLLAAGVLSPEDVVEHAERLEQSLPEALTRISKDPEVGVFVDDSLTKSSLRVQFFVVELYEETNGWGHWGRGGSLEEIAASIQFISKTQQRMRSKAVK